ncbi:rhomboid family intramembrane serine protease [Deinococcus yavapaiensis]|uniref:Membrane associated rhomboid family serine protease n=1 Tax=Deinococcus yavapaiensis KR-236 TaxID=694435 RepID=A0A318S9E9_9DEIO|nr:rhomboid family intramembrane serine protease [Deinococcus yavapaiensis]PYE52837.1 membrane associated rhomboid family serine protease [Deinococcus yavapaiensis KR-236]
MTAPSKRPNFTGATTVVAVLLGVMWIVELVNQFLFRDQLDYLGIQPRSEVGLRGLLFAPFLHADFAHLISNTVPFAVLSFLIALRSLLRFAAVTLSVMFGGGFAVWLTAPSNTIHLGASLLVFGYLGYLLASGWYERSTSAVVVGVLVLLVYGSLLWGVLPIVPGVSWQSHLFGFLAGLLAARLLARRRASNPYTNRPLS